MVAHRYWDSCVFLGWLKAEPDKLPQCEAALREAEAGKLKIITSTLTLAETLYLVKGEQPVSAQTREAVRGFFENDYIELAELDRPTAELAQDVVWEFDVKHKDAVHVATAVKLRERIAIEQLDTFDGPLASLNGKIHSLPIGQPNLPEDLITNAELHAKPPAASAPGAPGTLEQEASP
ncbi:MAG: type II toxin-antitoxin system VapC family toxin [Solirubrobacterales bacterium]